MSQLRVSNHLQDLRHKEVIVLRGLTLLWKKDNQKIGILSTEGILFQLMMGSLLEGKN
jgi:hypothetical protein